MDERKLNTGGTAPAPTPAPAPESEPGVAAQSQKTAPSKGPVDLTPDQEALRCVSEEIARKHNVLPLRISDGKLYVAMSEPVNVFALDDIHFITKKTVVPVIADAGEISSRIEASFSVSRSARALEDLKQEFRFASGPALGRKPEPCNGSGCVSVGSVGVGSVSGGSGIGGIGNGVSGVGVGVGASGASDGASGGSGSASGGSGSASGISVGGAGVGNISDAPAVRLADSLLSQAVSMKASDIHLEPFEDAVRVRYRVDGALMEDMAIPAQLYSSVSTRIKVMAGMDIAERRLPQDGRIEMGVGGNAYDFRVSSLPTVHGEKIEVRILDRSGFSFTRDSLGFTERENQIVDRVTRMPYGIVLVTGPTGSGKTTTIYSLLAELNEPSRNIVTIEDPVEYMIRGINQVQVNQKAGLTFAGGLRSILRQDPDIIMVGEIRDEETADIAVRAAITGHLVFSTLHTNDAPSAIARLIDMGVEPYLISEAVTCVIAQRLVRELCPDCKSARLADASDLKLLRMEDATAVFSPVGCPKCNSIGYKGRRAIHEVLFIDAGMKSEIEMNRGSDGLRALAVSRGMATLYANCCGLVAGGVTSIQEMVNTVYARDESF